MAKLDEQFMAGGGGGVSKDNCIEIQTVEEDEKITIEKEGVLEKQKIKLLSFLIKEGFLSEQGDGYVMKEEMLDDPEFKQRLSRLYLGRNSENKTVFGGLRRMGNLLRELKIKTEQDNINIANNNKGRWNIRSFGEIFDEKYEKKTLKEKVFDILKKEGVIEQIGDDVIVNVKDLKRVKFWQTQGGYIFRTKEFNIKLTPINTYKILGDIKVISREEYKGWALSGVKPEAKPLFNIPEDMDDAFSIENIKNKRYHLDVWEMYKNVPWGIIDILTKDGNSVGGRELYLAIKIFRDLQGRRGKDGVLRIFDQNKNTFVKISNQKLIEIGVITAAKSIRKILAESCHNLLASGIIKFDDFGIITNNDSGEIFRKEFISTNSRNVFKVMINSVNYYIGRKFFIYRDEKIPIKNIKIIILDKKNGGVVRMYEGREELIYTFKLLNNNEIKEKRNKVNKKYDGKLTENQISARVSVNKRELDLRMKEYSVTEIVPKKDNETPEEYGDRIGNLPDYGYVQKVTKKLSEKIGVGIHNLDWREQLQVATMEYETGVVSGSKDFIKFADRYKLNGLKTFLSLEQGGLEMGKKILKIGEKFKETSEVANAIFEKYAELVNAVEGVENYLKEQFKKEDPKLIQEIKENLLMRGKAILVIFADEEMTVEAVTERLKEIDTEVDILGAILRAMKNKGEKIDLNIVKDLSILSVYKLDENAINDVMALVKDSWDQNVKNNGVSADFAKVVINGLRGELESNRMDTEINILKYQDRPIGMIRFQIVDDKTLVVKSVNVHSRLKGINVGTFLFELIRKKSQEKNLKLDVLLKNQVSCHYISEIGFHGYGYNDNVKETNEPNIYAKLEKGKIKNRDEKYFTKQGGDIERIFNISTQKGLKEMRNFLKEHLLAIDDKGDIIEGQKYENKYTIVEQIQVGRQDDVRKIILRKNSVL